MEEEEEKKKEEKKEEECFLCCATNNRYHFFELRFGVSTPSCSLANTNAHIISGTTSLLLVFHKGSRINHL